MNGIYVCIFCSHTVDRSENGEPFLIFKEKMVCSSCVLGIIEPIYKMSGYGDGGFIQLIFNSVISSSHNRKKRIPIKGYKKVLKKLLHKYKFKCVFCGNKENLTIDHIIPVSKGGSDDEDNLQILCKSCNSKKGAKIV